jgi:hypothetical protein
MIQPLRRWHRRLIGLVIVTLAIGAWLALSRPSLDARIDALPASLAPARVDGLGGGAPR